MRPRGLTTWLTLARRRVALSARTPRKVLAPLATPLLFAWSSPRAGRHDPPRPGGAGYSTFVIVGTVGLLIPLTCTFVGIGVIVDRTSGGRRELLAAPIPRSLIVLGNMAVAITISLPDWLAWAARILSTTHTLALLRYGVLDPSGAGLHDIWHMTNTTAEAALSLLVLVGWAALATAVSIQVFRRSAVT